MSGPRASAGDGGNSGVPSVFAGRDVQVLASFRADRTESAADWDLGEIADRLPTEVRDRWVAKVRVRRLNHPYPLPVSWVPADVGLAEGWALLRTTAAGTDQTSCRSAQ